MVSTRPWLSSLAACIATADCAALGRLNARQADTVCQPATITSVSTTTVAVPVLTAIPACQGPLCSTNTITASGQPFTVTGLTIETVTPTSATVIGGLTVTNTDAQPTLVTFPTFTQCSGVCTVSSTEFSDVPVFFTTSSEVPASTTEIVGGQTCLGGQPCTVTSPLAMSTTFTPGPTLITITPEPAPSTTVIGGTTVVVVLPPVTLPPGASETGSPTAVDTATLLPGGTSVGGTAALPTTTTQVVLPPVSTQITTPDTTGSGPTGDGNTLVIPTGTTNPATVLPTDITTSVPTATPTGTATTCTTNEDCSGLSGTVCVLAPELLGGQIGLCLLPGSTSIASSDVATATGPAATGTAGTTGTTGTSVATPAPTSVLTPIACSDDEDCATLGLGICLQIPNLLGSVVGVCSSPGSPPAASVSLSVSGILTTTLDLGSSSTVSLPSVPTGAPSTTPSGTVALPGTSATGSGIPSASGSAVPCASNEDCLSAGLGLCLGLSLLDSSLLGTCAQILPTSRTASATATPSAPITIGSPCTSDAQCQAAGLGLCVGLNVNGLASVGTCVAVSPSSASATTPPVGATSILLPGIVSSVLSDITAQPTLPSLTLPSLSVPTAIPTGGQPAPVACSSNAQCFEAGLGVCVGLDIANSQILGVCAQVLPSSGPSSTGANGGANPTGVPVVGSTCTSDAQCLNAGLGLCVGLDIANSQLVGVCLGLGGSVPSSSPVTSPTGLPTTGLPASTAITVSVPTVVPTPSSTIPTTLPLPSGACRSNADCLNAGLGLCLGLTVGDTSILGVCAQVLPGTTTLPVSVLPSSTPLQVGSPCTSDAQCQNAGLGLCLGLNVFDIASVGTCAQLSASSVNIDLGAPTSTAANGAPTVTATSTPTTGFATVTLPGNGGASSSTPTTGSAAGLLGTGASCTSPSQCLANVCIQALGATVGVCA